MGGSNGMKRRAATQRLKFGVNSDRFREVFLGGWMGGWGIVLGRCAIDGGWARRNSSNKTLTTSLTSQP